MIKIISRNKDIFWLFNWIAGLLLVYLWCTAYLNTPALKNVVEASVNSFQIALISTGFSALLGWGFSLLYTSSQSAGKRTLPGILDFFVDLIKSIPQIIGLLIFYIILTVLILNGILKTSFSQLLFMSLGAAFFTFYEFMSLFIERVNYFRKTEFFDAMRSNGIPEIRIVNVDIFLKNSLAHIVHKSISVFGTVLFLQCSIDFIISVGLSTDVSLSNLPLSLGSMLAKLDSKQDILAISNIFTNPAYISDLLTVHLQGISVAFVLIYSLISINKMTSAMLIKKEL